MPNRNEIPREDESSENAPEVFDATEKGDYRVKENDEGVLEFEKKDPEKERRERTYKGQDALSDLASREFFSQSFNSSTARFLEKAKKIKSEYDLSEDDFTNKIRHILGSCIKFGRLSDACQICEEFGIPRESAMSKYSAKEAIEDDFERRNTDDIIRIRDYGFISQELINEAAGRWIVGWLGGSQGVDMLPYFKDVKSIQEKLNIPQEVIIGYVKRTIDWRIERGQNSYIVQLMKEFNMPQEYVDGLIIDNLRNNKLFAALSIKNSFGTTALSSQEVINASPEVSLFIAKLEELIPGFRESVFKSDESIWEILGLMENENDFLKAITENPFLVKALENNPRFATKLIMKYSRFDEVSKENIGLLFNTKEEILAANPDIDPNSVEFRKLMQEKLKTYKFNADILKDAQERGINTEEWLEYPEVKYFQLGEEDDVAFSEVVATPIGRVNETVDIYAKTIKEKLKEYKPELSEFKVPLEDSQEIEGKISQMRTELEKAQAEGNDKKAKGIEKGIEGLNKKKEKTVALWNKLVGDIDAFKILKDGVFGANESLKKAEEDLKVELEKERPAAKEVKKFKKQVSELKEELKAKFKVLEGRVDTIRYNLINLISPALGVERAQSIYQEIHTDLEEQFSHYDTDRSTLADLFSEKEDGKKSKLEKQPMNVSVWSRNPDIDLYQGNYSPCCICIESAHMGAESTIADYNTDLGIQVVNIWDESENKPVVAAWCWLGYDYREPGGKGEAVLVVDNIEANTLYSNHYSEQLTKELFTYLENYAKKIGVKRVVMGAHNNDLPTRDKFDELPGNSRFKYNKLWGANREGGYYLEAQEDPVKLIWKKEKE